MGSDSGFIAQNAFVDMTGSYCSKNIANPWWWKMANTPRNRCRTLSLPMTLFLSLYPLWSGWKHQIIWSHKFSGNPMSNYHKQNSEPNSTRVRWRLNFCEKIRRAIWFRPFGFAKARVCILVINYIYAVIACTLRVLIFSLVHLCEYNAQYHNFVVPGPMTPVSPNSGQCQSPVQFWRIRQCFCRYFETQFVPECRNIADVVIARICFGFTLQLIPAWSKFQLW